MTKVEDGPLMRSDPEPLKVVNFMMPKESQLLTYSYGQTTGALGVNVEVLAFALLPSDSFYWIVKT